MKKIFLIAALFFCGQILFAQKDSAYKKIEVALHLGYDIPMGGEFGKYYSGMLMPELSFGYAINHSWSVHAGGGYGVFMLGKLDNYIADKQEKLIVNAPPYTEQTGGGIQTIALNLDVKKTFCNCSKKISSFAMAGINFAFLEKAPVDATDSTGTYQILEHYVHEKPFGINMGAGADYHLNKTIMLHAMLRYTMYFTQYVSDKPMGILAPHIGIAFMF